MRRLLLATAVLLATGLLAACGQGTTEPGSRTFHPDAEPIAPYAECTVTITDEPATSAAHVPACSELAFGAYPPSSGTHFSSWAAFGEYDAPVPWGFLVHSLEHGAVVLAYRCETECPELVAGLRAVIDAHGDDPVCRLEDGPRFVLVPDPDLEWPIAAVAWEHRYVATCLDPESLGAFVDEHYGQAPEDLCVPGVDRSADGWCP